MICYNVKNATDAFTGLAESLDAVSRLPLSGSAWKSNADMKRDIANIIDLGPDADRIRAPFERAIEIANTARDEGTATALRKLLADLLTAHEKLTRGEKTESEYKAQLADVAASVRGLLADIAEDGTKRTDTAQMPEKVTVGLQPQDRKLLIDTKKAAQRADIQSKRAADNSQGAKDATERAEAIVVVVDIAEKTTVTQPPAIPTVKLVPEQAALLTKAADHSAAERAAASIDEIKGKMLALWRRWLYDEPYKPERTRETPPAEQKLCAAMNDAVFAYWKAFQNGELDGTLSVQEHDKYIVERKHKRSAKEFLETHGKDVVWTAHDGKQYTLQELCPTVEDVQRMIDRNKKAIRRAQQKNGQSEDKTE
jgi:hypothetical protein